MIGIIDYGVGNIKSFENIYKGLNIPTKRVRKTSDLEGVAKLILPGVGSFDYAMERYNASGLVDVVNDLVTIQKVPILGICVGMQMLAFDSEEGVMPGLGLIEGNVAKLSNKSAVEHGLPLPHMGWNSVNIGCDIPILSGLKSGASFYFLHSYYFKPISKRNTAGLTTYTQEFASIVFDGNIVGVQFHPEKSHENGIMLLNNFAKLC